MSVPLVTLNNEISVALVKKGIAWVITTGVQPAFTSFIVPKGQINDAVKSLPNPVSLKFSLNGSIDGNPAVTHTLSVNNLYLTEPKEVDQFTVQWQLADVRFLLRGKKIYRGYNMTRVKNQIGLSLSVAPTDPAVLRIAYDTFKRGRYLKNSVKANGDPLTITEILRDILQGLGIAVIFPDPEVSRGNYIVENLVFNGEDVYSVLADLLQKSRLNAYVDLNGNVCIYSLDFFSQSIIDNVKNAKTIAPGKIYKQELKRIRPPKIHVRFQNLIETLVVATPQTTFPSAEGDRRTESVTVPVQGVITSQMITNRTAIGCVNVIQVPFVPAAKTGVYNIGEYIPLSDYLADFGFTEEDLRKRWWSDALERQISFLFQAGGALTLEIETKAYEIAGAIKNAYRQLWMLDPFLMDKIQFWEDRRNVVIDNFSGYRPPSPLWSDFAMVPKIRNPEISQRRAFHTIGVRNWKANVEDPLRARPTAGRIVLVNMELGVFRTEYPSDKDNIISQIIPSAVLNPPTMNFADVANLSDVMLTFRCPLDPDFVMETLISVAWNFGTDDKFDSASKYTTKTLDYSTQFVCQGVDIEIFSSKELARLDRDLAIKNDSVLVAIAQGEAIRIFNQFIDRDVGYTILPGFFETHLVGNMESVEYSIDMSLGANTKINMVGLPPAPEVIALLPDSVRQYLYKQIGPQKGLSMFIADTYRLGIIAARDSTVDAAPSMRSVMYAAHVTGQNTNFNDYEGNKLGEIGGLVFWGTACGAGDFVSGDGIASSSAPEPRNLHAPDYFGPNNPSVAQESHPERRCGLWASAIPAVAVDGGYLPICDHSTDKNFAVEESVKPILGKNSPKGFPGVVVSGTEIGATQSKLFVPAGNLLCVDDVTESGMGTKILQVMADGFTDAVDGTVASLDSLIQVDKNETNAKQAVINLANCAKDATVGGGLVKTAPLVLSYLSSSHGGPILCDGDQSDRHVIGINEDGKNIQPAHIAATALYKKSTNQDGQLDFSDVPYPSDLEEVGALPVFLAFDAPSGTWKWFASGSLEADSGQFKIAWDWDGETDKSTGINVATNEIVHIDYESARGVFFNTAGDGTVFQCRLAVKEFVRNGVLRKLYKVSSCIEDRGKPFFFVRVVDKNRRYYALAEDFFTTPILTAGLENRVHIEVSPQWIVQNSGGDCAVFEIIDFSRGLDLQCAPYLPTPADDFEASGLYKSSRLSGGLPVATYERDLSIN